MLNNKSHKTLPCEGMYPLCLCPPQPLEYHQIQPGPRGLQGRLAKKKHGEAIHRLLTQLQGWVLSNGGSKQRCKEAILSVLISEPHLPETTQLLLLWFHDENVPDYF